MLRLRFRGCSASPRSTRRIGPYSTVSSRFSPCHGLTLARLFSSRSFIQKRVHMKNAWKCAAAMLLLSSSSQPAPPVTPPTAPEMLSRTEFTNRVENYFEYEPLRTGKPSQFLIHLTDLSDGTPVEQAEVTLAVRPKGSENIAAQTVGRIGKVTGIYVAELTPPKAGDYDIEFHIKNTKLDERLALSDFKVEAQP